MDKLLLMSLADLNAKKRNTIDFGTCSNVLISQAKKADGFYLNLKHFKKIQMEKYNNDIRRSLFLVDEFKFEVPALVCV